MSERQYSGVMMVLWLIVGRLVEPVELSLLAHVASALYAMAFLAGVWKERNKP